MAGIAVHVAGFNQCVYAFGGNVFLFHVFAYDHPALPDAECDGDHDKNAHQPDGDGERAAHMFAFFAAARSADGGAGGRQRIRVHRVVGVVVRFVRRVVVQIKELVAVFAERGVLRPVVLRARRCGAAVCIGDAHALRAVRFFFARGLLAKGFEVFFAAFAAILQAEHFFGKRFFLRIRLRRNGSEFLDRGLRVRVVVQDADFILMRFFEFLAPGGRGCILGVQRRAAFEAARERRLVPVTAMGTFHVFYLQRI